MFKKFIPAALALFLAMAACNLPGITPVPTTDPAAVFTMAALTVEAALESTGTPPQPPATQASPFPTPTNPPTQNAPQASPAASTTPCNLATFVTDVTYPDDTLVEVNKAFTKTWRLKNVGTCTWTSGYQVVFDSGDLMGGPTSQPLTNGTVTPGQTVDISVNLTTPASPGTYRGNWKLREPGGVIFSLTTGNPFWVQVKAVPVGSMSLPAWPTLKKGSTGAEVTALQYLLNFYGDNLVVDGSFGNNTRDAVKDFQQSKSLDDDGIVGPKTWAKLAQTQVANGASGDAVRAVQYLLSTKFGYNISVDGLFGPKTRDAVSDFQDKKGLQVDGIVGPQTWQALISY